jgi:predicted secreted protein
VACKMTSKGTKFYYDVDGVDPYTEIASVQSVSGPNVTMDTEEQTELASTGAWKEFCASFKDGGEVTLSLYMKRATATLLHNTIFAASTAYYWKVQFPLEGSDTTESKIVFQAWITAIGSEVPDKGSIMLPVTLKVTGAVTYTAGS